MAFSPWAFWCHSCLRTLPITHREHKILSFVAERTVNWNKLFESVPLSHFRDGVPAARTSPVGLNSAEFYRARKSLLVKGYLLVEGALYALNVPLILMQGVEQFPDVKEEIDEHIRVWERQLKEVPEGLVLQYKEHRMKLRDVKEKSNQTAAEARKKKLERDAKRKDNSPDAVFRYLESLCESQALMYIKSQTERVRTLGRHFVKECRQNDLDWKKVLRDAIEHWRQMAGTLKNRFGQEESLSTMGLTFESFYFRRHDILLWLAEEEQGLHWSPQGYVKDDGPISTEWPQINEDDLVDNVDEEGNLLC